MSVQADDQSVELLLSSYRLRGDINEFRGCNMQTMASDLAIGSDKLSNSKRQNLTLGYTKMIRGWYKAIHAIGRKEKMN